MPLETHGLVGVWMLFSNGASWLLVLSLLGSCLLSCFGCPICLANVLLLILRILPARQSAEKNLNVKRSCYGPLPCVPEVGRLNYSRLLLGRWMTFSNNFSFSCLDFPFFCVKFNDIYLICKALWTVISGKLPNSVIFSTVLPLFSLRKVLKLQIEKSVKMPAQSFIYFNFSQMDWNGGWKQNVKVLSFRIVNLQILCWICPLPLLLQYLLS